MVQFCGQEVLVERDFIPQMMRMRVNADGKVLVKIRYHSSYTEEEIQQFVDKHSRYLRNRLAAYATANLPDLSDGGKVTLLGKEYTVMRQDGNSDFDIEGNVLKVPKHFYHGDTECFFGNLLLPYVKALTELYSEAYGLKCYNVGLYTWQTAWGTYFCEYNTVKYNAALVFVPLECIEYVVVHELCHSLHSNHSAAFWTEVERICPRYKELRTQLRKYDLIWLLERTNLSRRYIF